MERSRWASRVSELDQGPRILEKSVVQRQLLQHLLHVEVLHIPVDISACHSHMLKCAVQMVQNAFVTPWLLGLIDLNSVVDDCSRSFGINASATASDFIRIVIFRPPSLYN